MRLSGRQKKLSCIKPWMNMQAKVDFWNSMELRRGDIEAAVPLYLVAASRF